LLALQAIAWQARTIGKQLDWIASMRARMIASLQTCVPIANLLYMCKAKKLLPGGNAFLLQVTCIKTSMHFILPSHQDSIPLATSLHAFQLARFHESILLVYFPPFAVERHLVACMLVSMRDSS
jgi:hypothetical protein